ncbi:hypothetical protein [Lonepinella sp. BR2357]|uniref:hypothetical protein n=1 Tax=Lonepinella sp. BR2357 TaxID=3434549 RepID=UPI003F6DB4EA
MYRKIALLLLTCYGLTAFAKADPFDKQQRTPEAAPVQQVAKSKAVRCPEKQADILPDSPFEQLTLIGILLFKEKKQILLQNKAGEVESATEQDLIGAEAYQLLTINKSHAEFQSWKADCSAGEIIKRKL